MIRKIIKMMMQANARRIDRNVMLTLSDHVLKDIGLTRDDARDDNLAQIWDAPQPWKRPSAKDFTARLPRVASIY